MLPIQPSDSEGLKWLKLQASIKAAVIAAGVTIPESLTDVSSSDSDGIKWAKTQRWLALLSTGSGGTGGTGATGPTGPIGVTGPSGLGFSTVTLLTSSRNLVNGDAGLYLYNTVGNKIVTIPDSSPLTIGQEVQFFQSGTGTITLAGTGSIQIISSSLVTSGLGGFLILKKISATTYHLANI